MATARQEGQWRLVLDTHRRLEDPAADPAAHWDARLLKLLHPCPKPVLLDRLQECVLRVHVYVNDATAAIAVQLTWQAPASRDGAAAPALASTAAAAASIPWILANTGSPEGLRLTTITSDPNTVTFKKTFTPLAPPGTDLTVGTKPTDAALASLAAQAARLTALHLLLYPETATREAAAAAGGAAAAGAAAIDSGDNGDEAAAAAASVDEAAVRASARAILRCYSQLRRTAVPQTAVAAARVSLGAPTLLLGTRPARVEGPADGSCSLLAGGSKLEDAVTLLLSPVQLLHGGRLSAVEFMELLVPEPLHCDIPPSSPGDPAPSPLRSPPVRVLLAILQQALGILRGVARQVPGSSLGSGEAGLYQEVDVMRGLHGVGSAFHDEGKGPKLEPARLLAALGVTSAELAGDPLLGINAPAAARGASLATGMDFCAVCCKGHETAAAAATNGAPKAGGDEAAAANGKADGGGAGGQSRADTPSDDEPLINSMRLASMPAGHTGGSSSTEKLVACSSCLCAFHPACLSTEQRSASKLEQRLAAAANGKAEGEAANWWACPWCCCLEPQLLGGAASAIAAAATRSRVALAPALPPRSKSHAASFDATRAHDQSQQQPAAPRPMLAVRQPTPLARAPSAPSPSAAPAVAPAAAPTPKRSSSAAAKAAAIAAPALTQRVEAIIARLAPGAALRAVNVMVKTGALDGLRWTYHGLSRAGPRGAPVVKEGLFVGPLYQASDIPNAFPSLKELAVACGIPNARLTQATGGAHLFLPELGVTLEDLLKAVQALQARSGGGTSGGGAGSGGGGAGTSLSGSGQAGVTTAATGAAAAAPPATQQAPASQQQQQAATQLSGRKRGPEEADIGEEVASPSCGAANSGQGAPRPPPALRAAVAGAPAALPLSLQQPSSSQQQQHDADQLQRLLGGTSSGGGAVQPAASSTPAPTPTAGVSGGGGFLPQLQQLLARQQSAPAVSGAVKQEEAALNGEGAPIPGVPALSSAAAPATVGIPTVVAAAVATQLPPPPTAVTARELRRRLTRVQTELAARAASAAAAGDAGAAGARIVALQQQLVGLVDDMLAELVAAARAAGGGGSGPEVQNAIAEYDLSGALDPASNPCMTEADMLRVLRRTEDNREDMREVLQEGGLASFSGGGA